METTPTSAPEKRDSNVTLAEPKKRLFAKVVYLKAKNQKVKAPQFPMEAVEGMDGTEGTASFDVGSDRAKLTVGYIMACARAVGLDIPEKFLFGTGQVFFDGANIDEVKLDGITPTADDPRPTRYLTEQSPTILLFSSGIYQHQNESRAHIWAIVEGAPEEHSPNVFKGAAIHAKFDFTAITKVWEKWRTPAKTKFPKTLAQQTYLEARATSHAISDAPTATSYVDVEGELAVIHTPRVKGRKTNLKTRFQPTPELWNWWGIDNPTQKALREALTKLNFETNITFQVTLACLLGTEHARRTFTLDEIIKLIGRDTDARRSSENRQKLRREVWGNILTLASMPVIGARNGVWREPGPKGEKRAAMPKQALESRDPLLVITGGRTTDDKEPPKEISLTAGEWLMPKLGNREILSDFGDVLKLAQIPRGKVSGAWAACIGLALQQKWREEATKAEKKEVSRGKTQEPKVEVLKFRPFTRRELLTELFKCDDENSPNTILSDPKGRRPRAEEYWKTAIEQLKKMGLIGYYREMKKVEEMNTNDLNEAWFDQPLDIRPSAKFLKDALEIHNLALEARKRARRSGKKAIVAAQ